MEYTCVDSFCGAGGLSLGLRQAGFEVVWAFDKEEVFVETYESSVGDHVEVVNATELTGEKVLENAGLDPDSHELDLFAGGPPCQGFSKQKRGAEDGDERNQLVLEFSRLVRETTPRFFLLENVKMFGKKRGRRFVDRIGEELRDYVLYPHTYNAADYGLPQKRERFIMVGKRRDVSAPFNVPEPTVDEWQTVEDFIGDLPEPPEDYSDHPNYTNHQRARVTDKNIKRFSFVPPGGGWQDIPEEYRLECHKGVDTSSGGWPDVYGRLEWDGQAPTITGGFDSFTRGRYGHPEYDRPITPREAARMQGFPDDFEFQGTRYDIRHQIGNAVPPPLASAIGNEIRRTLLIADGHEEAGDRRVMDHAQTDQYAIELTYE